MHVAQEDGMPEKVTHLPTNGHQWSWKDTKHNDILRIRMYVCEESFDGLEEKKNPLLTRLT